MNTNLKVEVFDKIVNDLLQEAADLQLKQSTGIELSFGELQRQNFIYQLHDHIFSRKLAWERMQQADIAVIRCLDVLGINLEKMDTENQLNDKVVTMKP